jgi:adenosylhomocysteinase
LPLKESLLNLATATTPKHDIANPALAAEGKKRIEWADRNMPVLAQIRERFEREKHFK